MASAVALKYAKALSEVASETGAEDQYQKELTQFGDQLEAHQELLEVLTNPAVPFPAKRAITEKVAAKMPLRKELVNFLLILLKNNRLMNLEEIETAFAEVLDDKRGVARGEVYSAQELTPDQRQRLESEISELLGKQVHLIYHLDSALIGGFRVQIGSVVYDGSIRTQLEELRKTLIRG